MSGLATQFENAAQQQFRITPSPINLPFIQAATPEKFPALARAQSAYVDEVRNIQLDARYSSFDTIAARIVRLGIDDDGSDVAGIATLGALPFMMMATPVTLPLALVILLTLDLKRYSHRRQVQEKVLENRTDDVVSNKTKRNLHDAVCAIDPNIKHISADQELKGPVWEQIRKRAEDLLGWSDQHRREIERDGTRQMPCIKAV